MAASNFFKHLQYILANTLNFYQKPNLRQYSFCNKNCVNFGIKLNADISIWMQSRFDGFDFSATLASMPTESLNKNFFLLASVRQKAIPFLTKADSISDKGHITKVNVRNQYSE